MFDWTTELPDDERDKLIDKVADGIVKRKLATPAIMFLEMHKPLAYLSSQGLIMSSPFVAPFVGVENLQAMVKILEKRENVERIIQRIEELSITNK